MWATHSRRTRCRVLTSAARESSSSRRISSRQLDQGFASEPQPFRRGRLRTPGRAGEPSRLVYRLRPGHAARPRPRTLGFPRHLLSRCPGRARGSRGSRSRSEPARAVVLRARPPEELAGSRRAPTRRPAWAQSARQSATARDARRSGPTSRSRCGERAADPLASCARPIQDSIEPAGGRLAVRLGHRGGSRAAYRVSSSAPRRRVPTLGAGMVDGGGRAGHDRRRALRPTRLPRHGGNR
jgi:hypothetical protein